MDKESVLDKKFGWYCTLDIPEKDGVKCKIYQRPIPGRSIKMCRNDTVQRGVSIDAWKEFSLNFMKYSMNDP